MCTYTGYHHSDRKAVRKKEQGRLRYRKEVIYQ